MRWLVVAVVLFFSVLLLAQDVIFLDGGGKVKGTIIEENEEYVIIKTKGGEIEVRRENIERIEYGVGFQEEYQRRIDELDKEDPNAWYELGKWCRTKGYEKEAEDCFRKAIEIDPDHKESREELGYYKLEDKWVTEEEYWRAKGYERYGGEWLPKEEVEKLKSRRNSVGKEEGKSPNRRVKKKRKKTGKEKWQRQMHDKDFYRDSSGSVPWEQRKTIDIGPYILITNLGEKQTEFYVRLLKKLHKEYSKMFGPIKTKSRVYIHATQEEFMRIRRKPRGVGGYYSPRSKEVVTYHGLFGKTKCTQDVLSHECTHQFHDAVSSIRKSPMWFIEGLATFFEASEFDEDGNFHIGVVNAERLPVVQREVKANRAITLDQLLSASKGRFSARYYAYAWSFIYLIAWCSSKKGLRKVFEEYWAKVVGPGARGDNRRSDGFRKILESHGYRLEEVQEYWYAWVMTLDPKEYPKEMRRKSLEFEKEWWKSRRN